MIIIDNSFFFKAESGVEPITWILTPGLDPGLEASFDDGQRWFLADRDAYCFERGQHLVMGDGEYMITNVQISDAYPDIFPPNCEIVSIDRIGNAYDPRT